MTGVRVRLATTFLAVVSGWALAGPTEVPAIVRIAPSEDAAAALSSVPPGTTVILGSGRHQGPLKLKVPLRLEGEPGAEVVASTQEDAAITISARDVSVEGITVTGGWTGIDLLRADDARLSDVEVVGAEAQGVRVYARSALLDRVSVRDLTDPHAQGIEILSAPDVEVRNSRVTGGKIGIVAHLSEVSLDNNHVTGTGLAAVVIREMSRGSASSNHVSGVSGAGLYCGDMSTCAFEDNVVTGVTASDSSRSGAGWGLVVHYRSTASSQGDLLLGEAGGTLVLGDSRIVAGSALRRGSGAGAILPTVAHSSAFLLLLLLIAGLVGPRLSRRHRPGDAPPAWFRLVTPVVLLFLFVQTFHMLEHVIQLSRVHARGVPGRGGLAGQVVDNEWAHFLYNAVVLAGMGALLWVRRAGWRRDRGSIGDGLLVSAVALQTYHLVEHTVKLYQHLSEGMKVAPGILGGRFDLVYLHFGINVAVYFGFAGAVTLFLLPQRRPKSVASVRVGTASGRPAHR